MSHHMNWNTWPVCSSRIGVRAQLFVSWPVKRNKILGVNFPLCASDQHHNVHTCNIIIRTPERRGHISFLVQYFYPKHCYSRNRHTKEVHTSSHDSLPSLPSTNSHQLTVTDLNRLSAPTFWNPAFRSAQKWLLLHFSILSKFKATKLIKPDRQTRKRWAVCLRALRGHCVLVLVLVRDVLFYF